MAIVHNLTIGEMSIKFGVSHRTLRFYEQKGLLRPERIGTARMYLAKDQIRLELLMKGKRFGFALAELLDLIEAAEEPAALYLTKDQIKTQISSLSRHREVIEKSIEELRDSLKRQELSEYNPL